MEVWERKRNRKRAAKEIVGRKKWLLSTTIIMAVVGLVQYMGWE